MKKIEYLKKTTFKNKRSSFDDNQKHYDTKWRKFSTRYRNDNPWCVSCMKNGIWNDSDIEVDHIEPIEQSPSRKYDPTNLQSLCKSCHSTKTYSEKLSKEQAAIDINRIRESTRISHRNPLN